MLYDSMAISVADFSWLTVRWRLLSEGWTQLLDRDGKPYFQCGVVYLRRAIETAR